MLGIFFSEINSETCAKSSFANFGSVQLHTSVAVLIIDCFLSVAPYVDKLACMQPSVGYMQEYCCLAGFRIQATIVFDLSSNKEEANKLHAKIISKLTQLDSTYILMLKLIVYDPQEIGKTFTSVEAKSVVR
ncbi:hypothetical protein CRM22_005979 [Opisthorchis felineus]|uniref:Uncharacterized protein n=1 Tax=Opisthorchis felineus TaxID=147828 RepID=A0A4S2LNC8_OPIFE|nr:hypothetical protein CRM22_005979 [Opisthorchis felineus]